MVAGLSCPLRSEDLQLHPLCLSWWKSEILTRIFLNSWGHFRGALLFLLLLLRPPYSRPAVQTHVELNVKSSFFLHLMLHTHTHTHTRQYADKAAVCLHDLAYLGRGRVCGRKPNAPASVSCRAMLEHLPQLTPGTASLAHHLSTPSLRLPSPLCSPLTPTLKRRRRKTRAEGKGGLCIGTEETWSQLRLSNYLGHATLTCERSRKLPAKKEV